MKNLICYLVLVFSTFILQAQTYPVTQNLGNTATTKVKTNALEGKLIITAFTDTTAANTEGYLKNYDGSLIKTTSPINALWYRVLDSAKWVQILPTGGGSGGTRAWLDGGNYNVFADGSGNAVWGTLANNGIKMTTNATTRLLLNKAGIQAETANTVPLGVDTVTKDITYSTGGGGGGSSWLLAGNAGTTPLTSFLGTTDSVALRFRVNNQPSGIIQDENSTSGYGKGNTALGQHSLESTTSGVYNTALGLYSLYSNTTGEQNTAVGMQALLSSTGDDNTAIGLNALNATTGDDNTAIGTNSLQFSNGTGLIALGSHAGLNHTTGNRRLYINGVQKTTLLLDTTESIIYGAMDSSASNQRLYLNSKIYAPYLSTGIPAGAKRVLIGSDNQFYAADTTSGGGSSTITNGTTAMSGFTNTYIPYNNAGTIGQYAISGTGNVAMSASPTFTGTVNGADANFTGLFSVGANPLGTDIAASKSGLNIYYNTTSTTSPVSFLLGTTAAFSKSLRFQAYPASYSTSGMERADEGALFSVSMPLNIGTYTAHDLKFWANNAQKMTLASNGDLSVANLTTNGYVKTSGGIGTFGVTSSTIPQADVTNLTTDLAAKQATLVSGTNIKTVNGNSLLGSGDVVISGSGSTTSTQVVATDADITAANNRLYVVPASTLSANRNIDVSGLTTNLDYIELVNYEPTYTYTFTGATVYLLDGVTTVTTITNPLTIIKRINGKLTVTN